MAVNKEWIEEKKDQLNTLISKNRHSKLFDAIEEINTDIKSSILENAVLRLRSRLAEYEKNTHDCINWRDNCGCNLCRCYCPCYDWDG